jgi:SPP1 gp7 family putative phage head morphogenesis protein
MLDIPVRIKSLRSSPLPLMRGAKVKRLASKVRSAVLSALNRMNAEAIKRVESGKPPLALDALDRWTEWWIDSQRGVLGYVAVEGGKQARAELGMSKSVTATAVAVPGWEDDKPVYIGAGKNDFLIAQYQTPVDGWLKEVASASTKKQAAKIERVWKEAREYWDEEKQQGMTPREIADRLRETLPGFTASRARMIAYTDTNWAFNSGIRTEYKKMGVTVLEWMTSEDDSVCPWCRAMDGVKVGVDDPFWREGDEFGVELEGEDGTKELKGMKLPHEISHPPLHPNCACVLLPVLTTLSDSARLSPEDESRRTNRESASPESGDNDPLQRSIDDCCEKIRHLDYERQFILDKSGKVVSATTGTDSGVKLALEESKKCRGAITIHNHPSSCSFSIEDISGGIMRGEKKAIVVGKDGSIYELEFPKSPAAQRLRMAMDIQTTYNIEMEKQKILAIKRVQAKEVSIDDATRNSIHEVVKILAEIYNLKYKAAIK